MTNIKTKLRKILLFVTGFAVLYLLYAIVFDPISSTFNVTVSTERITFETKDGNGSRLILDSVEVAGLDSVIYQNFSGSFEIERSCNVRIERVSFGPLIVTVTAKKGNSAGKLYDSYNGDLVYSLPSFAEFIVYDVQKRCLEGGTIVLPVDGDVILGRAIDLEIFGESTALLRSGELAITGTSSLIKENFEAGNAQLHLGDQLVFEGIKDKAFGFVTINENSGIQAAYRVKADRARILKPGPKEENGGYTIEATILDRFLHAALFQSISLFFAVMLALTSIITFVIDFYNFKNSLKNE